MKKRAPRLITKRRGVLLRDNTTPWRHPFGIPQLPAYDRPFGLPPPPPAPGDTAANVYDLKERRP